MTHSQTNHAQVNRTTPSSELAQVMAHPDSFRLLYFPLEAQGQTSRDLLTYGGAKWESASPQVHKFLYLWSFILLHIFLCVVTRVVMKFDI